MFAKGKSKIIFVLILTILLVMGMGMNVQQSEGSLPKYAKKSADFYWMHAHGKVNFTAISLGYDIINYTWHFGDGNISYGEKATHQYSDGNYTIMLTMRTGNGSTIVVSRYLNMLGGGPEVDFYWSPETPTTQDTVYFFDNSTDPDKDIYNWTWVFGDGRIAYGKNVTHRFSDDGTYNVTLVVRDHSSGGNSITKQIIVLNVPPIPDFYWTREKKKIRFLDYSKDNDGQVVNWTWDFGDGNISYEQNPLHDYPLNRSYMVKLKIRDNDGEKNETVKVIDITNPLPTAHFSWSPQNPTILDIIYFTDLSSDDGEIVNWTWDFGDGNKSYKRNPVHQYSIKKTYKVNLTVIDDDHGFSFVSKEINVVNAPPVANFSWDPQYPTPGDVINFTDLSNDPDGSIVNWTWDFGDGNISYTQNTTHAYAVNGTYKVNLTVKDNDGKAAWKEEDTFIVAGLYVDDDAPQEWYDEKHVRTVQEGIINATAYAFICVLEGTYRENVIVDKTVCLTAKNATVDASATGNAFFLTEGGIEMSGFFIRNASNAAGIEIQSDTNTIRDCSIADNKIGIYLNGGGNNVIFQNKIEGCGESILINNSHENFINKTTFDESTSGITIREGSMNDISNNTLLDLTLYAVGIEKGIGNKISHNLIKFNPYGIRIFSNAECSIIENIFIQNGHAIYLLADEFIIERNEFINNDIGIYTFGNAIEVKECTFSDRIHGIKVENVADVYIHNCAFSAASTAILIQSCIDTNISHSTFNGHDIGIQLVFTENAEIFNCSSWENEKEVEIKNSTVKIHKCLLHNNSYGLPIINSSFSITNSSFNDNTHGISGEKSNVYINNTSIRGSEKGIRVLSSQIFVNNTTFKDNTYGMDTENSTIGKCMLSQFERNEYGIYLLNSSSISVTNCSFSNNSYGIYGKNCESITYIDDTFLFNGKGIAMANSNACSFIRQSTNTNTYGMELTECTNFQLKENKIEENDFGVRISKSPHNTLLNNQFNENTYNFDMEGLSASDFYENIDTSNTINGEPIYYLVNKSNLSLTEPIGYLGMINCTNVTVKNTTISNNGEGLLIIESDDVSIEKSTFHDNLEGSILLSSSDINFSKASVYNNLNDGILFQSAYDVSIVGCTIYKNGQRGINIYSLGGTDGGFSISENEIRENWLGINIENTAGNVIVNNTIENNEKGALRLFRASTNDIGRNNFTTNGYGMDIRESPDNNISHNYLYDNENGMYVENSDASIKNSSFEGCDVGIFSDLSAIHMEYCRFYNNSKGILNFNSSLQISNSSFLNNTRGGEFISTNFTLSHSTISGNMYGIISYECTEGTITNCSGSGFFDNDYALFLNHSKNLDISRCDVFNNTIGIYLINSSNNEVNDCKIFNSTSGIVLINATTNKISQCLLHHNSYGAKIESNESIFFNNSFWRNEYGIWIDGGIHNTIYHNNFAYNTKNAYDNANNTWDNGYPSGGNYWSDYAGGDKFEGILQNTSGSDGIGDIPYNIGGKSKDGYPLMNMSKGAATIPNRPPVASFVPYPGKPFSLENVLFTDTSTDQNGKMDINAWKWDFGDGNNSTEQNPEHAYAHSGAYNVTLTVTDSYKENATITIRIEVKNVPPTANFSWSPHSPSTWESVQFTDTSSDIDGSIVNYTWDFGDGSSSKNKNTSYTYHDNGVYIVKLTVTDNNNATAEKTQKIFVENTLPTADFYWIADELVVGENINFTDNSNDEDGNIVSWHWEFGDGKASNERHPVHSYEEKGKHTITLTIKDDDGGEAKVTRTIEIEAKKTPGFELIILLLAALLIFTKREIIFKK